jgi:two-component system OmpR family response regulator
MRVGPVTLDTRNMRVSIEDMPLSLSPLEYRCLSYLMHHAGRVIPPGELMEHLYPHDHDRDPNAVEVLNGRSFTLLLHCFITLFLATTR